jgi:hypothetical protein
VQPEQKSAAPIAPEDWRALRRAANEEIERVFATEQATPSGRVSFVCECVDLECIEPVLVTLAEFAEVKGAGRDRFLVAPGHEQERERIVARRETFVVVQAVGRNPLRRRVLSGRS